VSSAATPPALRFRARWRVLGGVFVGVVVWLSLTPSPLPAPHALGVDVGHVLAYAFLMAWFAQVDPARRARLGYALALCALGVALEVAQGFTSYRVLSASDMRDDALGVAAGWMLALSPAGQVLAWLDARLAAASRGRA
jgi:VanZ family protein